MNPGPNRIGGGLLGSFDMPDGSRYALLCNIFPDDERETVAWSQIIVKGADKAFELHIREVRKDWIKPEDFVQVLAAPPMFTALVNEARVFMS